ncbi:hypothetical protein E3A20_14150 [Planctomyces bekefii]|uniref:Uncharacterized protein n=1 Tax=Planctomyces bekefii TaxID=1653850 RepID=A0A5C6M5H7_9PLAN|nr:hypothetical protein E3A20_14150 [Planctomyces bekefii]
MASSLSSLKNFLLRAAAFDGEYEDQLANHLPMTFIALDALGADENRLEEFFKIYSNRRA